MAPSRRKGAGKAAAAAAAARRQWKVGDLVLAKVKGFPAWPATVSEPEKWGYAADWKKVLVYFFGTQQIAFCNPADVEAFTEEKKQSLLVKRQGKGADFVRAVQEIIDSYEKSKKPQQVDDLLSGEEATLVNGGHSMESSAHIELKDQTETSEATVTGRNDPHASSIASGVPQIGSSHGKEGALEQPSDNMAVTAKPGITTYTSRKRSGGLRSRKRATQRETSVERSGSFSRLESSRFQTFMIPSSEGNKSAVDLTTDIIADRSLQRNKRIRKSPDPCEWDDVNSSALVSNGSIEDNGSEIATVDSDSLSLNEGSTMDSASKPDHSENFVECSAGDVELSKGLDFPIKAMVAKRKRKPNKKRVTSEAAEPPARLELDGRLDAGAQTSGQDSQNACKNLNERHNKEDGDEHLPLVKRARVRMGKLSSLEEHASFSQAEEKASNEVVVNRIEVNDLCPVEERASNEVAAVTLEWIGQSTNLSDDCSVDKGSFPMKGALDNALPPKGGAQIPVNRPQLLIVKENPSFVCSADDEAALPPSKRLHRALEAMSANAAEEGQACAETSTVKTSINDSSVSTIKGVSHTVIERKESSGLEEHSAESAGHRAAAFSSSSNRVLEESTRSPLDAEICNEFNGSSTGQRHCNNALTEVSGHDNCQDLKGSCFGDHTEDAKLKGFGIENPSEDIHISGCSQLNSSFISQADEAAKASSLNSSDVLQFNADGTGCENAETLKSQIDDSSQANGMCEEAKVINYAQIQKEFCYAASSDDHLGGRDVLVVQSSPVPADGLESPARTSPPTTSICHVSTAESANFIQNSGCSSPNHSQQKATTFTSVEEEKIEPVAPQHPKSVGKLSSYAETHAALSSFEGMLGSLTRTKESIGRATRIAIDCAKFGVSSKVVEILARTLESESSLHRRVDLFFLVDSIAQCSRGLRGDVGGIYPSAIQPVLQRLLSAAAPPGSLAQENRRQCLKVLRLWLERRILPESVIRHHIRELDSLGASSSAGAYSRRSSRTERPLDDPVREMEGMLVDEYGSNSSFQLPGFCMPRMLKDEDEGSDSDGESFEAVTPEHNVETPEEHETVPAIEKHTHILEDVDGELEMEDVAPSCEVEASCTGGIGVDTLQNSQSQLQHQFSFSYAPPLPQDVPPSSPPLPTSPPPPPPPLPPPPPSGPLSSGMPDHYASAIDSKFYSNSHDLHDDLRESVAQQSAAPSLTPSMSNGVHYHATECRDQMQTQLCESTNSFSSYPVCPVNNVQHTDGSNFPQKAYLPRPPHPPPSNQFSYVQAGQHGKSRRASPPSSYHHRFPSAHNADGGNFYNNHDRMRPAPYDESWRYPPPPFSGTRYPDKPYPPGAYGGPPQEPTRMPHHGWPIPPRGMHHRNFMPFRPPPSEVPVSNRAPSIWRPR